MRSVYNSKFLIIYVSLSGLIWSCDPEIEVPSASSGSLDFTTYVALGNSLTAGYLDNALYQEGQLNAYPAIIADQLRPLGMEAFNLPLVPEGNGINTLSQGRLQLQAAGGSFLPAATSGDAQALAEPVTPGPYHNLGIPGAKSFHLLAPGYGSASGNPFFERMASSNQITVLEQALNLNPTFFSLWIGNNDVLGYAVAGGVDSLDSITTKPVFTAAITETINQLKNTGAKGVIANIPDVLDIPYFNFVTFNSFSLSAAQADEVNSNVLGQIDSVITVQVTQEVIVTVSAATAVATQAVYEQAFAEAKLNGADDPKAAQIADSFINSLEGQQQIEELVDQITNNLSGTGLPEPLQTLITTTLNLIENESLRPQVLQDQIQFLLQNPAQRPSELTEAITQNIEEQISLLKIGGFYPEVVEGPNPFIVEDPNSPTGIRFARSSEKIPLQVGTLPIDQLIPLSDAYFLTESEIEVIEQAVEDYNQIINGFESDPDLAIVDMNGLFQELIQDGFFINGINYTRQFILGNAFSLDGIHLTPAGSAIVANKFIETINEAFGASVSPVVVTKYRGNEFP